MEKRYEKVIDGILLGIGMTVGFIVITTCLVLITAFVESVLTIF